MSQKHILSRLPNIAFLCGANHTKSMRSKFLKYVKSEHKNIFISDKSIKNIFSNERIIIAEQAEDLWEKCLTEENAGYDNLLEFEMDIAELATTIPIFLEGVGPYLETGAFFCKSDLRKKLLIIVNKKYLNKDSFIQKAIIKDKSLRQRIISYDTTDSKSCNQKILEEIFSFRRNWIGHQIDTRKDNPKALYFFLLKILCNWKTKEEILNELNKAHELKKYGEKIDNHLKILLALGLIIKEHSFKDEKFLSVVRNDNLISDKGLLRNIDCEKKIFNQIVSKLESSSILLKYMKQFADEDYFSYSYYKHSSGGYKKPKEQLDILQKTLRTRILNDRHIFPVHKSAMGFVEKNNIRKNVENHSKNQFILKIDFKYFFHSIKRNDFLKYLKDVKILDEKFSIYSEFICDISFKDDSLIKNDYSLPIGASTSPLISNILLYFFDEKMSKYSDSLGMKYTRYVDDLTFSHNEADKLHSIENKVREVIATIPYPSNLRINDKKIIHMSKKGQRKITGLYLTPNGRISIGRNKKNYIKKLLRDYEKGKHKEKKQHIQGYLCFIKSVEREFWSRLHDKYVTNYREKDIFKSDELYKLFYDNELSRQRKDREIKGELVKNE